MKLVLAPHPRTMEMIFWPEDLERLRSMVNIEWGTSEPLPEGEAIRLKADAEFIASGLWNFGDIGEDAAPKLRGVFELSGGHRSPDVFDYHTCFARGIRVLSCAPAFAEAVAEMSLAHALATLREVVDSDRLMRIGKEQFGKQNVRTLYDATVGIIGYGNLARALQPLLTPFRCRLQAYDPWLPDSYIRDQDVKPLGLDELLSTSDVIFILNRPTAANKTMLTKAKLELVKPGGALILVGRAHVVDFDALLDLAEAGRFSATIDVFPEEPPPSDHRVRKSVNTILTPHLAGSADHARRNIGRMLVKDIEAMSQGLRPYNMQLAEPEIVFREQG